MFRPRTAAAASLLLIPIVAGGFFLEKAPVRATPRLFDQVLSLVANRYVDSLQGGDIYEKAAHGLVRELNDPYSELLAPKQNDEFNRSVGGRYGGVGMLLEEQKTPTTSSVVVSRVFPHTPAEEGASARVIASSRSTRCRRPTARSTRCPTRCEGSRARRCA